MPSARPSAFKGGGGGILRDQDGTIVGLEFTPNNPLWEGKPKPKGSKTSDFKALFAVLDVLIDGADAPTKQPIFVGDAEAFEIVLDGHGISGEAQLSKSSGWFIILNSLVEAGFPEDAFPDDPEGLVADYTALVGARCRFNWQKNEAATKKYGQRASKKDPKKKFDREDLIVTNYYGQADDVTETPAAKPAAAKTTATAKSTTAPKSTSKTTTKAAPAVDVADEAAKQAQLALAAAKGNKLSKAKLSVKILTQMSDANPEVRADVREYLMSDDNLDGIEGIAYNRETQEVSLDTE